MGDRTRDTTIHDRVDDELMRDEASGLTDHALQPIREVSEALDNARWSVVRELRRQVEEKHAALRVAADLERERNELRREVEAHERTLALKNAGADAAIARQAHELMEQMIPVVETAVKWRTCHVRDEDEKDWLHTLFVRVGQYLDNQEAPVSLDELRQRVPGSESGGAA